MALWQEIMNVPGLSGSWENRNKKLYYKLGAPYGTYKGNLTQNMWLLNQIRNNNFFRAGLPGTQPVTQASQADPRQAIADAALSNVVVAKPFEEVMPQEVWGRPFDEWTRNFASTYMEPEWRRNVYDPAIENTMNQLDALNRRAALRGSRSVDTQLGLQQAGQEAQRYEESLRTDYQDRLAQLRENVKSQWSDPLYKSVMTRYQEAPWRNINLGEVTKDANINLGGVIEGVPGAPDLESLLADLANTNISTTPTSNVPTYDWSVKGESPNLFSQYNLGANLIGS